MKNTLLSSKLYDRIKFLVQVLLPAVGTLYFALGSTWNLPNVEQTLGSIAAITTFLGVLLKASKSSYDASDDKFDGQLVLSIGEQGQLQHLFELNDTPDDIPEKSEFKLKVVKLN